MLNDAAIWLGLSRAFPGSRRRLPLGAWSLLTLGSLISFSAPLPADTQILRTPLPRGVVFPAIAKDPALGTSVTGIGDFNGDGVDDIALGAVAYLRKSSAAYIVFGRRDFPAVFDVATSTGTVRIGSDQMTFGTDVIAAGDVDGDGLADLYIHQPVATTFNPIDPHLYLVYGSRNLPEVFAPEEIGGLVPGAVLTGFSLPTLSFRNPIAPLGDFNGDGTPDVAIGQPVATGPLNEKGKLTILFNPGSLQGEADLDALVDAGRGVRILGSTFSGELEGFGSAVASAGDVNGDALTDLVVSDPKFTTPLGAVRGRVYLVYGSRDFPPLLHIEDLGDHGVSIEGQTGLPDSARVFGGGDLDGDGFPEFGFNVQERTGFNVRGRLLAVRGALALPSAFSWEDIESGARGFVVQPADPLQQVGFGQEVWMAPDEDGDGRAELIVGSPPGEVLVLSGAAAARGGGAERPLHEYQLTGFRRDTRFLGLAGDPNADGIPDYLVSDPDTFGDNFEHSPGRVYLLFGGYETRVLSVAAVSPARGPMKESTQVTVSGTGFMAGARVLFGTEEATKVELQDPHTLLAQTPLAAGPRTVDVTVILPDSRKAVLPSAFTFIESLRRLSVEKLAGVIRFESPEGNDSTVVHPTVLGDVNGDGLEDYALKVAAPSVPGKAARDAAHLVFGGTSWPPIVPQEILKEKSVRFVNTAGYPPDILPLGDLNQDGRAEYAVARNSADYDISGRGEFAVVFVPLEIGKDVDFSDLRGPGVAFYSSHEALGFDVWLAGDFDGDGQLDLVTHAVKFNSSGPPRIVIIRGPIREGEDLDLDSAPADRVTWISDQANPDIFAEGLGPIGDFNGDGRSDLAFHTTKLVECCGIFIILGHELTAPLVDIAEIEKAGHLLRLSYGVETLFESSFAPAGDVNDDGFGDLLIHGCAGTDGQKGYAGILLGRKNLDPGTTWEREVSGTGGFFLHGSEPGQLFGNGVALQGDIDGNGRPDLVIGSFRFTELAGAEKKPGLVHIVHDVNGLVGERAISDVARPVTVIEGVAPADRFGATVQVLGDQDGDGLPELLVEAPFDHFGTGASTHGMTFMIPGSSLFGAAGEPVFVRGDANLDGLINISDAITILGALFLGTGPLGCEDSADTNDDGVLNVTDAIYLLEFLFRGGPALPQPYPTAGPDPTADGLSCTKP